MAEPSIRSRETPLIPYIHDDKTYGADHLSGIIRPAQSTVAYESLPESERIRAAVLPGLTGIAGGYLKTYGVHFKLNLGRVIASGGQGVVYEGMLETDTGREEVLAKVIPNGQTDPFAQNIAFRRVAKEYAVPETLRVVADLTERFSHLDAHIPHVMYPGVIPTENGKYYFILFEHQSVVSLSDLIADASSTNQKLSVQDVSRIFLPVADVLSFMHEAGYVHRDVKPGNIVIREDDGLVQLIDFGSVKPKREAEMIAPTHNLFGTLGYVPPEHFAEKPVGWSPATDSYGLGAAMYHALTGVPPYFDKKLLRDFDELPHKDERNKQKILFFYNAFANGDQPTSLYDLRPDLDSDSGRKMVSLIETAMHPNPDERVALSDMRGSLFNQLCYGDRRLFVDTKEYPVYNIERVRRGVRSRKHEKSTVIKPRA